MALRDPWLFRVVAQMQSFAGEFAFHLDESDARRLALGLATRLPHPPDREHNVFLATLLLSAASRISRSMHETVRAPHVCDCDRLSDENVRPFLDWQANDARAVFAQWASHYFHAFGASHPPQRAERVARLLRASPQQAWTLAALAKAVHTSATGLRAAFFQAYGVTPHVYMHTVRIARAIVLLADDETASATAQAVGYRSRKDFYRVFRQITGVDPSTFAAIGLLQRTQISDRLSASLRPLRARRLANASTDN